MIVLVGPSGSGKTTIEQELIKRGYKRTISCTTRPQRKGEKHGLNYYFISECEFAEKIQKGLMLEFKRYGEYLYGLPLSELSYSSVVVVEPSGYKHLKNSRFNVCGCYLFCDEDIRRQRMLDRGDDPETVEERISNDKGWFKGMEDLADIVVDTSNKTIDEIIACIMKKEVSK
jgi:guanylate kinase